MPRMPVEDIDVLIVDEMGKNISGFWSCDTNILGRAGPVEGELESTSRRIRRIVVRDLTPESHG